MSFYAMEVLIRIKCEWTLQLYAYNTFVDINTSEWYYLLRSIALIAAHPLSIFIENKMQLTRLRSDLRSEWGANLVEMIVNKKVTSFVRIKSTKFATRGGAAAARLAHNQEVTGSSPVPATKNKVSF